MFCCATDWYSALYRGSGLVGTMTGAGFVPIGQPRLPPYHQTQPPTMAIVFAALLLLIAYFLYIAVVDFNEVA